MNLGQDEVAFLLIGHGTRNQAGQQQLREVAQQFEQLMSPCLTELAFLELAEPSIPVAVRRLAERGAKRLISAPVLLFAAGHALSDIPTAVEQAASHNRMTVVGQAASLELSPAVLQLSALRFRQAVCQKSTAPSCRESCEGTKCGQVALAMIGRGSRSESATEQMRHFVARRWQITPVAELATGFIFAQSPTVEEVLQPLTRSHCPRIVVQPHLLFEGELVETLRKRVAELQSENQHQKWIITGTLGTDFALAATLAELAREVQRTTLTKL